MNAHRNGATRTVSKRLVASTGPTLAFAVLLVAGLAGCTGTPSVSPTTAATVSSIEGDTITPGTWAVGGNTDRMLVWVHNHVTTAQNVTLTMTSKDGAPLPSGWQISFASPNLALKGNGVKHLTSRGGYAYDDWGRSMVTLTIPADEAAGTHTLVFHAGDLSREIVVTVDAAAARGAVTGQGSKVHLHYDGHFTASGERFDQGEFDTVLGSGQTVPGFDNGLMGLRVEEKQTLVVPPALAYGYDNPPGNYAKFNGQWLSFTVTINSAA